MILIMSDASSLFTKALKLHQSGDYQEAIALYKQILDLEPNNAQLYNNLGHAYLMMGQNDQALQNITHSLKLKPDLALAYFNLSQVYENQLDYKKALYSLREILKLKTNPTPVFCQMGIIFNKMAQFEDATQAFTTALKCQSDHVKSLFNLGHTYRFQAQYEKALECYQKSYELAPQGENILLNIGITYRDQGLYEKAEEFFNKAIQINPDNAQIYDHLGMLADEVGDINQALNYLDQAITKNPNNPTIHYHRGLLKLKNQDASGWQDYEWRLKTSDYAYIKAYQQALWDGSKLAGKHLLVHTEQGLGDEIKFAQVLGELARQAGQVTLVCEPRLAPLLQRSYPSITVIGRDEGPLQDMAITQESSIDFHIPIASCFQYHPPQSYPQGYLTADKARVRFWQERLQTLGPKRKIGIVWQSQLLKPDAISSDRIKGSTNLSQWQDVLAIDGSDFINLQYGQVTKALAGTNIHNFDDIDLTHNIDDLAALITALDLVISIDSSTAALAASLGKEVWTLVTHSLSQDNTWFPTMTFIVQKQPGDWDSVFSELLARLV